MRLRSYLPAIVLCVLSSVAQLKAAEPAPQGPLGGPQIAVIQGVNGDVRVSRAATPNTAVRAAVNLGLANGDTVRTLQGVAEIRFNDNSLVTLNFGTVVTIAERPAPGGFLRSIRQSIGSLWFNVTSGTNTRTELATPTAVAAIRGTEGTQVVPGPDQSTHALNEGIELVTEGVTGQSVTIRAGQSVTAIRGIGFTPVVALVGLLARPVLAGGGGGAAGGGGGGGAAGGAGGGVAGGGAGAATGAATTGATAATTATVSTVSSIAATVTSVGVGAASGLVTGVVVPLAAQNDEPPQSGNAPLSPPGGAVKTIDDGKPVATFAQGVERTSATQASFASAPANRIANLPPLRPLSTPFIARLGGTVPLTAVSGSLWALGAVTHNGRAVQAGQRGLQAIFAANAIAGGVKLMTQDTPSRKWVSGDAMRTFAFARVMSREYRDKPWVVFGSYGLATAVSMSRIGGQNRPTDVIIGAALGEVIGRIITRGGRDKNQ